MDTHNAILVTITIILQYIITIIKKSAVQFSSWLNPRFDNKRKWTWVNLFCDLIMNEYCEGIDNSQFTIYMILMTIGSNKQNNVKHIISWSLLLK